MRLILKHEPFSSNAIYWLLVGKIGLNNQYILLGRFIDGKFEFNHKQAKIGYIYRDDIQCVLQNFTS
jgi:hypothetical protein